jgi:hypothetical protein
MLTLWRNRSALIGTDWHLAVAFVGVIISGKGTVNGWALQQNTSDFDPKFLHREIVVTPIVSPLLPMKAAPPSSELVPPFKREQSPPRPGHGIASSCLCNNS